MNAKAAPRVVHVINQFFGGIGAEEAAGVEPRFFEGPRGPGLLLGQLAPDFRIAGTVVFGDNAMAEGGQGAAEALLERIEEELPGKPPDLVVAGPAFGAGRYGLACAAICRAAERRWPGIVAVTGMAPDNPAVDTCRKEITIVKTADNVIGMRDALEQMIAVARKRLAGGTPDPETDGTVPRGVRVNAFADRSGARRALDMLVRKRRGEPFTTEYPMPVFDRVPPAPAIADAGRATIALVTSGGIVPRGNPDQIESASAHTFGEYPIDDLDALDPESHESVHGGYDPTFANADPNRVLPLDAARELERAGRIGKLHDHYFATVGNATSVSRARAFGEAIADRLRQAGVQAVILTST